MNKWTLGLWLITTLYTLTTPAQAFAVGTGAATIRFYQPQADLSYQELAATPAITGAFCAAPRPDTVPLPFNNSAGQPIWLQLGNEQGNLRWFGAEATGVLLSDTVLPATGVLPEADAASLIAPPLLLLPAATSAATGAAMSQPHAVSTDVVWHDMAADQYQRADLSDLQAPRLLWRWSPPTAQQNAWLQTPVLAWLEKQQAVLLINSATAAKPALWLLSAATGQLLAELDLQSGYRQGQQAAVAVGALKAPPATLDLDGDGAFDRVYQIDEQGQLLRLDMARDFSYQSSLVANLTGQGLSFASRLLAVRALLPVQGATSQSVSRKAVDVVVLLAERQQQYQLMVLFLPEQMTAPLLLADVQQNHQPAAAGTQLPARQTTSPGSAFGWVQSLAGQPLALPEIIAGVLYLPMQSVSTAALACDKARQADVLLALHLYQASAVYTDPELKIPMQLPLRLATQKDGSLALQQSVDGKLVLEALRGVAASCAGCTEVLNVQQLSQWQQLATYRQEEVH